MAEYDQYHCFCCNPFHRGHRNIGFAMVVCGFLSVCIQIAATIGVAYAYKLCAGIWAGGILIGTGATAIAYQKKKTGVLYILYAVLSHISAASYIIVLGASAAGIHEDWESEFCDYHRVWRYKSAECYWRAFKVSMHIFLVGLGISGIILALMSACIIWSQICCKAKEVVTEKALTVQQWEKVTTNERTETDV